MKNIFLCISCLIVNSSFADDTKCTTDAFSCAQKALSLAAKAKASCEKTEQTINNYKKQLRLIRIFNAEPLSNEYQGVGRMAMRSFVSNGGSLLILASASAFSNRNYSRISMSLWLDKKEIGSMWATVTQPLQHQTFVTNPIVLANISEGTHFLQIRFGSDTWTGKDNSLSVTIIELPAEVTGVEPFTELKNTLKAE